MAKGEMSASTVTSMVTKLDQVIQVPRTRYQQTKMLLRQQHQNG